ETDILSLFGVDAQPAEVLQAVLCRPLWLDLGELAEVIAKAINRAAVEAGPKRRLAHRHAAHLGQRPVVVGNPPHHVNMWVDVIHRKLAKKLSRWYCHLSLVIRHFKHDTAFQRRTNDK